MLALHCHTSVGLTMHGLTDALRSARSVADRVTARFVEYPAGHYPVKPVKCAPKILVSLWGKMCGPTKQSPTAEPLTENRCRCLVWTGQYGFTSPKMCQLWTFNMLFPVKPASSVKSIRLLQKGSSLYCRKYAWRLRKSRGLRAFPRCEWYGCCNCSWRTYHTVVRATCSAAFNTGMGILLYVSQYSLFHINCSCTSPSSAVYLRRANCTHLPDANINGVRRAWVRKCTLTALRVQPDSCCAIATGLAEN
jgi:hypothetical protein